MAYVTLKRQVLDTAEFKGLTDEQQEAVLRYLDESDCFYADDKHLLFPLGTLIRVELVDVYGDDFVFPVRIGHLCIQDSDSSIPESYEQPNDRYASVPVYGMRSYRIQPMVFAPLEDPSINLNSPKELYMSKMPKAYQEVSNIALDLKSKLLGILTCEGLVTFDGGTISLNPVSSFAMPAPSMALRTPLTKIRKGDIMLHNGELVFVASAQSKSGSFDIIKTNGTNETISPVNNTLLGNPGVLIVQNQFSDLTDASVGALLLAGGNSIDDADSKAKKLAGYAASGLLGAPEAPEAKA